MLEIVYLLLILLLSVKGVASYECCGVRGFVVLGAKSWFEYD